jgi:hypothetical protein
VNGLGSCPYLANGSKMVFQIYPCQDFAPFRHVVRLSGAARLPDPSGRLWRPRARLGPRTVGGPFVDRQTVATKACVRSINRESCLLFKLD